MLFGCRRLLKCDGTRAETRFRLSAKRTSPFKSAGASVQSTTGSRGVSISGSNAGYTMLRGSVKSTGYPLHSPVSPSLPFPCVTVCHRVATGLLQRQRVWGRRSPVASLYVQEIGLFIGGCAVNRLYKTCTTYLSVFRNCVMLPNMGCVEPRKGTVRLPSTTLGKCLVDFFSNSSHVRLNRKSSSHYENNQQYALYRLTLRRLMSYIYMEHPFLMFLDNTQRRSTVGRTPLDE